jgi:hypothetical protein
VNMPALVPRPRLMDNCSAYIAPHYYL